MSKAWIVDDELLELIEPLLPPWAGQGAGAPAGAGPPVPAGHLVRAAHGISWDDLPQELGFGSGMTCWRRSKRWTDAGVFDQLHQILLARLNAANRIDWTRAATDGSHIDAKKRCRHRSVAGQPR